MRLALVSVVTRGDNYVSAQKLDFIKLNFYTT
jgi:hypothetical protein